MNIAICDDNIYTGSKVESLVDQAFGTAPSGYECEVFTSADNLLDYLNENPLAFQLYLLDIEMEGTNGLEAAAKIRLEDPDAVIIFLTSHAELMPEAFRVLAFQYIIKPFDDEKTIAILLSAIRHLQDKRALYQYTVRKKKFTLYLSQIEYLESVGRKMVIHTRDGQEHEYYGTLKDAAGQAAHISFAQLHNSYIINMVYLDSVDSHSVTMCSGAIIPVSSKYHNTFHQLYRKFVLSQSGL